MKNKAPGKPRARKPIGKSLSRREKQVLEHLSNGHSTEDMARKMKLSALTVETYRKSILRKLNAPNAVGAVAMALRSGLIE